MNKALLFICLLSFVSLSIQIEPCATIRASLSEGDYKGYALFDICQYANQNFKANNDVSKYEFSLLTPFILPCNGSATNKVFSKQVSAFDEKQCQNIAQAKPKYSLADASDKDSGLVISFDKSEENDLKLTVTIGCDHKMDFNAMPQFTVWKVDGNDVFINGTSFKGCAYFGTTMLNKFVDQNKTYFIVAAVLVGLFITFFGLKLFHVSVFLVVFCGGTLFMFVLFFTFIPFGRQDWMYYIIVAASIILGLVKGYIAVKYEKVGFFALGAGLGVVGGFFLYTGILSKIPAIQELKSILPYAATLIVCGLIGGLLTFWLWKDIIIIATSVIGGYATVRGLSLALGHFPSEWEIAHGVEEIDIYAYVYLAGAIVVALIGMFYQFKVKAREAEKEKAEDPVASYYTRA